MQHGWLVVPFDNKLEQLQESINRRISAFLVISKSKTTLLHYFKFIAFQRNSELYISVRSNGLGDLGEIEFVQIWKLSISK